MKLALPLPTASGPRDAYAYTGGKPWDATWPCVVFVHGALHEPVEPLARDALDDEAEHDRAEVGVLVARAGRGLERGAQHEPPRLGRPVARELATGGQPGTVRMLSGPSISAARVRMVCLSTADGTNRQCAPASR